MLHKAIPFATFRATSKPTGLGVATGATFVDDRSSFFLCHTDTMKLEGHYVNVGVAAGGGVLHTHENSVGKTGRPLTVTVNGACGYTGFIGTGRI